MADVSDEKAESSPPGEPERREEGTRTDARQVLDDLGPLAEGKDASIGQAVGRIETDGDATPDEDTLTYSALHYGSAGGPSETAAGTGAAALPVGEATAMRAGERAPIEHAAYRFKDDLPPPEQLMEVISARMPKGRYELLSEPYEPPEPAGPGASEVITEAVVEPGAAEDDGVLIYDSEASMSTEPMVATVATEPTSPTGSTSPTEPTYPAGPTIPTPPTQPAAPTAPPDAVPLVGDEGDDRLRGGRDNDVIYGLGGSDVLSGRGGDDWIAGGAGNDDIVGGRGADVLLGGEGGDEVSGGAGADQLFGDAGDDILGGGRDDDFLVGGTGNDELSGDGGADRLWGGEGADTLSGGSGADDLMGGLGDDAIDAGVGNDRIWGGAGNDAIDAGRGDDVIYGEAGNDIMAGGAGDDVFYGGAGDDIASGAAGNDLFVFGFDSGSDHYAGGAGWSDSIRLEGIETGPDEGLWTLEIENDIGWSETDTGLVFDESASGRIELADGSELTFEDVNEINWGG